MAIEKIRSVVLKYIAQHKLIQKQFAQKAGIQRETLCRFISGKQEVREETLYKIGKAAGMEIGISAWREEIRRIRNSQKPIMITDVMALSPNKISANWDKIYEQYKPLNLA